MDIRRSRPPPIRLTFTTLLTLFLFRFLVFRRLTAFPVAFILVVTLFAAVAARDRAAQLVLMFDLQTIFGLSLLL